VPQQRKVNSGQRQIVSKGKQSQERKTNSCQRQIVAKGNYFSTEKDNSLCKLLAVVAVWTQFQLGNVTGRVHHDDKGVNNKRDLCSLIKMSYLSCSTNELHARSFVVVVVVKL
jgi:hypothetical protein